MLSPQVDSPALSSPALCQDRGMAAPRLGWVGEAMTKGTMPGLGAHWAGERGVAHQQAPNRCQA